MEMKHKLKHIKLRCSNHGFTLIELMIALAVSLLALAAIYSTFLAQHKSYQVQSEAADMQQNIRAAMYYMQREIRMAGSNPFKTLPLSSFGITAAGSSSITFTEDVRGINPTDGPDGNASESDENITYQFDAVNRNLVRFDNTVVPPAGQIVARDIDALNFVYLDEDGNPTATLADIRSVEITIVARTKHSLLYGTKNNVYYKNQQGTTIFGPAGDNVSRRLLTTLIYCRNLGL